MRREGQTDGKLGRWTDRLTDKHDEANSPFSEFCERSIEYKNNCYNQALKYSCLPCIFVIIVCVSLFSAFISHVMTLYIKNKELVG